MDNKAKKYKSFPHKYYQSLPNLYKIIKLSSIFFGLFFVFFLIFIFFHFINLLGEYHGIEKDKAIRLILPLIFAFLPLIFFLSNFLIYIISPIRKYMDSIHTNSNSFKQSNQMLVDMIFFITLPSFFICLFLIFILHYNIVDGDGFALIVLFTFMIFGTFVINFLKNLKSKR